MGDSNWYDLGYNITWFAVLIGSWIFCIELFGLEIGICVGWLPGWFLANLLSLIWPAVLACIVGVFLLSGAM